MKISAGQLRAARGLIGWSQGQLSEAAKVARATIADFESGKRDPYPRTIDDMRRALEAAGVIFVEENGEGPGVRLRKQGKAAADHPEPAGPATEVVKAMDAAISEHRKSKTKK
jgi:transcriptional regulator with XRE-family HTH domain